jgi:autotransporter-associated beta strand protein
LVPNADGAVAVIAASTTTALTVTLDSPQSIVGMLILGSGSTTTGYTLSGSTLTFSNTSNSTAAAISVIDGTHAINAPVILASNLVVTSTSSNPWTLSFGTASSITDNGNNLSLTMSASNGTLILSGSDDYTGGTIVTAGTLDVTNPEAIFTETSLIVGENAQSVFTASSVFGASATSGAVPEPGMLSLLGVSALGFSLGIREPRPVVRARKTENASAKVGGSVS